ncbi:MAG: hypothetical protein OJF52_002472 [Nitrospira sp.]|nr:MAG: hypothetical protein OJF52_002472 [Nitrospira sp.]
MSRPLRRAVRPRAGTHRLSSLKSPKRRSRCSTTADPREFTNSRIILTTFFNVKEFPGAAAQRDDRKDRTKS